MEGIPPARRWHSLTPLVEDVGKCILYGGYDGNFAKLLNDVYILDIGRVIVVVVMIMIIMNGNYNNNRN